MNVEVHIVNETDLAVPEDPLITRWVTQALQGQSASLSMVFVDEAAIQSYNRQYRQKDKPTNVLSFANQAMTPDDDDYLGDVLLCPSVVMSEAKAQGKTYEDHFAHMVIHATLHLRGFDHQTESEASAMEALEISLLNELGMDNPYEAKHG